MAWTKWSYMDHWVTETPQGPQPPSFNRAYMDRYVKQLSALGFTGFDTFFFYLPLYAGMYGGVPGFAGAWLRHRGLDWAADLLPSFPGLAPGSLRTADHPQENQL